MLREFAHHLIYQAFVLSLALPLLLTLEWIWPIGKPGQRLKGLAVLAIYTAITSVVWTIEDELSRAAGLRPLFGVSLQHVPAWATYGVAIGFSLFTAISYDFFYYWFHRAQHALAPLWRFHAVHHAIRDMNAANAYPHWTEELTRFPFITVPVVLLVPAGSAAVPWIGMLSILQAYYIHSATRLHFGPLGRFLCDNRFHRLHHSIEAQHFDKNFGVITPLWDWMFGTMEVPAKGEWPQTGLRNEPEIDGIVDYLGRPFRRGRAATPADATAVR